jgi:hypothetical protein
VNLIDLFDSVYVINLLHRTDRRRDMTSALKHVGWDSSAAKLVWFPAIDPRTAAGFASAGARGAYLSHLAVLNMARNAGHRRVLVLEDDCNFAPDFQGRQRRLAESLDSTPWGIAYLGHRESVSGVAELEVWDPGRSVPLLHCYAVDGKVLRQLTSYLEAILLRQPGSPDGGPMFPDAALSWFRRHHPQVQTVLAAPPLASQRSSRSDITMRWFDRVPVLRDAAEMVREHRRQRQEERKPDPFTAEPSA